MSKIEIQVLLNKSEVKEIAQYLKINNIKIKQESNYTDSCFDTILGDLKKQKQELIYTKDREIKIYNNTKQYKELIYITTEKEAVVEKILKEHLNNNNVYSDKILEYNIEAQEYEMKNCIISLNTINFSHILTYDITIVTTVENYSSIKEEWLEIMNKLNINLPFNHKSRINNYFNLLKNQNKIQNIKEISNLEEKINIEDFIIVVEGKKDALNLRRIYPSAITFETHGLGLTLDKIMELKNISEKNNKKVLILTDPDIPGEIIRRRITQEIPDAYHKYIYQNENLNPKNKKQIGIEALNEEGLKNVFKNIKQIKKSPSKYVMKDLINIGIYENKEARLKFCKKNNIAFGNNKKVLKQINDYNIKI